MKWFCSTNSQFSTFLWFHSENEWKLGKFIECSFVTLKYNEKLITSWNRNSRNFFLFYWLYIIIENNETSVTVTIPPVALGVIELQIQRFLCLELSHLMKSFLWLRWLSINWSPVSKIGEDMRNSLMQRVVKFQLNFVKHDLQYKIRTNLLIKCFNKTHYWCRYNIEFIVKVC